MKIHVNSAYESLRSFVETLPAAFDSDGETLHEGRNTIRAFDIGTTRLVVKRYKRPGPIRRFIYGFLRKSKARRAYEHALRLQSMGIDTPEPVAWSERRRGGCLTECWFVSRHSDFTSLAEATRRFPDTDTLPVLEAFAHFAVRLHDAGVVHEDFNHGNILYRYDPATQRCRFQLIDINRMRFKGHALPLRSCMVNLRRLSCPAVAFLYILDRYAEIRGWNVDDTLLRGTFFRLAFGRRKELKKRFRRRREAAAAKKQHRNSL